MKRISGGQTSLGADCHAPIRSRRRSSGGGERQELSQSDQPVDRDFESQPAASPRTNRTSRTSPPGRLRDDDSDGAFLQAAEGTRTLDLLHDNCWSDPLISDEIRAKPISTGYFEG